jgi:hypothetical protein
MTSYGFICVFSTHKSILQSYFIGLFVVLNSSGTSAQRLAVFVLNMSGQDAKFAAAYPLKHCILSSTAPAMLHLPKPKTSKKYAHLFL